MAFERVEFLSDKALFKGKVYLPKNLENSKGIVIFTHGLGYCDRQYKISGEVFAGNGYLMLTYNLRGHAGTEGKWTLQNSVEDLIEGINFITRRYRFKNNNRICVIGHSTGALITLLASIRDHRIKFGSVVTTVTCLTDSYLHWFSSGYNVKVRDYFRTKGEVPKICDYFLSSPHALTEYLNGKFKTGELDVPHRYGMLHSESFGSFFHEIAFSLNILKMADQIQIPLLLFRGEEDEVIHVQKTNELYEMVNRRVPSRLYITGSRDHFHNDDWTLIQEETLKFFDEFCAYQPQVETHLEKDILVVDDEELVLKSLRAIMNREGYRNVVFATGAEDALNAIGTLKKEKDKFFDLIISDIRMPAVDGIEFVKRARQIVQAGKGGQLPRVIFITGYASEVNRGEAQALGYVDFLEKPFDIGDFLRSIKKYLGTTSPSLTECN